VWGVKNCHFPLTKPVAVNTGLALTRSLDRIIASDISLKTISLGYSSVAKYLRLSAITLAQCAPKAAEFGEITQNMGHFAVQGHSRSPILVPIESSYDFLLVINTNFPPILHRFGDNSIPYVQNRYISPPLLRLNPQTEGFPCDDLRKIFRGCQWMVKVPNDIETLPKFSTGGV